MVVIIISIWFTYGYYVDLINHLLRVLHIQVDLFVSFC